MTETVQVETTATNLRNVRREVDIIIEETREKIRRLFPENKELMQRYEKRFVKKEA